MKNLPFKITDKDMYDIFGKYGAVRQIRVDGKYTGTAFVVYEDIFDAKRAQGLSGFNADSRYLIVFTFSLANGRNT